MWFLAICLFVVVVVIILGSRMVRQKQEKKTRIAQKHYKSQKNLKQLLSYNQPSIISLSEIKVPHVKKSAVNLSENVLGFGSFGSVHLAEIEEDRIEKRAFKEKLASVHLESYSEKSVNQQEWLSKVLRLKSEINHPNVTKFVAIVKESN